MKNCYIFFGLILLFISCDENDVSTEVDEEKITGTGAIYYDEYSPLTSKPINVFYHIPDGYATSMPILFVLHGAGRNAAEYRNAWIEEANAKNIIIIAPEFSDENFPGGDQYNLGNVFVDGDNPSTQTLNNEAKWTFSLIEPIFNKVKSLIGNSSNKYDIYGHSAGAQFAHRFLMLKPNANVNTIIASAAGWYTLPDDTIEFPYGIQNSPIENIDASNYFSKKLIIQIGTLDNDPNSPGLRHNSIVDMQGDNRYDRAYYFYNESKMIAEELNINFNWQLVETPNEDHDYKLTIPQAADLLYN
ncbi:hypothetical protein [Mesonia maritima]|uniref:Pimeloyl-ACP methyl ester carboxylesterase n=1 Tax=Mesonia maritima TaxID=1793873 RepID=A0ABU1K8Y8_9FLAO|nr:hypothetical protein [Mesonia maritima]MDR6302064.1 pimeloyl-ACP methyl ester carboxylesterase [Mesonia maritima]